MSVLSCNIGNDALMFPQSDSIYNSGIYSNQLELVDKVHPAVEPHSKPTQELHHQNSIIGRDEMFDISLSDWRASVGLIRGVFTLLIIAPLLMKY